MSTMQYITPPAGQGAAVRANRRLPYVPGGASQGLLDRTADVSGGSYVIPAVPNALPQTAAAPAQAAAGTNFLPAAGQRNLTQNPMLPQAPVDAALDAQYYAGEATLRSQISQQYADLLNQLGYTDAQGNFIPGSISAQAQRQQADLQRSSDLAEQEATRQAQAQGTLFSGLRGENIARAQYPFQQAMLQLGIDVPTQLGDLYRQASGLIDQFTLGQNQLLADAASRKAQAIAAANAAAAAANQPPITINYPTNPPVTVPPTTPPAPTDGGGYTSEDFQSGQTLTPGTTIPVNEPTTPQVPGAARDITGGYGPTVGSIAGLPTGPTIEGPIVPPSPGFPIHSYTDISSSGPGYGLPTAPIRTTQGTISTEPTPTTPLETLLAAPTTPPEASAPWGDYVFPVQEPSPEEPAYQLAQYEEPPPEVQQAAEAGSQVRPWGSDYWMWA